MAEFGNLGSMRVFGYWSKLSLTEVLHRARRHIGANWHLFDWNCEQIVRVAHGLKAESPQLKYGLSLLGGAAVVFAAIQLARRG